MFCEIHETTAEYLRRVEEEEERRRTRRMMDEMADVLIDPEKTNRFAVESMSANKSELDFDPDKLIMA